MKPDSVREGTKFSSCPSATFICPFVRPFVHIPEVMVKVTGGKSIHIDESIF